MPDPWPGSPGIQVEPAPAPPPSDPAVAARLRLGLSTDPAVIAEAARAPQPANLIPLGIRLTPAERKEAFFEMGPLEEAVGAPAFQSYLRAHADTSAGHYLSHDLSAPGTEVVLFTRDVAARAAELARIFTYPSRLSVRSVPFSEAQLDALQSQVFGDRELAAEGVHVLSAGVDDIHNAVLISIGGSVGPSQLAVLRSRFANAPLLVEGGGPGIA